MSPAPPVWVSSWRIVTEGDQLTLQGERRPLEAPQGVWHRQERGFGKFTRTVTLPVLVYNAIRSTITPDLAAVSVIYVVLAAAVIGLLDRKVGLDLFLKSKQG